MSLEGPILAPEFYHQANAWFASKKDYREGPARREGADVLAEFSASGPVRFPFHGGNMFPRHATLAIEAPI